MLTLTIDGRAVTLSAEDANFLTSNMHAAMSHRGQHFDRTHRGASSVFRVTAGDAVRELPAGVQAFSQANRLVEKVRAILTPNAAAKHAANAAVSDAVAAAGKELTDC